MFKDILLCGLESHVTKMNSKWSVDRILEKNGLIVSDWLKSLLVTVMVILIIMHFMCIDSILAIEVIIIIPFIKLMCKQYSLKIFIFINWWFLWFSNRVVIVVVLIEPSSILVEEINVFGVLDTESSTVGKLSENFKSFRVWLVVGLHGC